MGFRRILAAFAAVIVLPATAATATAAEKGAGRDDADAFGPRLALAEPALVPAFDPEEAAGSGYARRGAVMGEGGTFSFVFENDFLAGTDRNYTNGFRFSYVRPPKLKRFAPYIVGNKVGEAGVKGVTLDRALPLVSSDLPRERVYVRQGFQIGQSIFTPRDTAASRPDPDDRPYAGWLYVGSTWVVERRTAERVILDTFQVNVGIVGPAAFGDEVQNQFHRVIGDSPVNGWDFQLDNEPGVELI